MADMKQEILEAVKDKSFLPLIEKELAQMEQIEGLDEKPVLQKFHSIWKHSHGKVGHRNDINSWTRY
jgi:hypothetical protein